MVWNIGIIFNLIYGIIIPTGFHIFQRGRYTTNQIWIHMIHMDFGDYNPKKSPYESHVSSYFSPSLPAGPWSHRPRRRSQRFREAGGELCRKIGGQKKPWAAWLREYHGNIMGSIVSSNLTYTLPDRGWKISFSTVHEEWVVFRVELSIYQSHEFQL